MTTTNKGRGHRAAGAMLGMAVGDALGAPYEFGRVRPGVRLVGGSADMTGGGPWERGEWTDDTAMAMPILRAAAAGLDLMGEDAQDRIVSEWRAWSRTAKDVGNQTREVLRRVKEPTARNARMCARDVHQEQQRSAGNGSAMRTAPVGLAHLNQEDGPARVAAAASAIAALTHYEADARDGAALWSVMIHLAVRDGRVSTDQALAELPVGAREHWAGLLTEAEGADPDSFAHNGWIVHAIQAAWAALHRGGLVPSDPSTHTPEAFRLALQHAIDIHNDTDTVAAIAGGLAGALVGASAVPLAWTRLLHGWGGVGVTSRAGELTRLAALAANGGRPDSRGWMTGDRVDYSGFGERHVLARHPHDAGVWIGGIGALESLPAEVDAVVSLCQVGAAEVPARIAREDCHEVWLIDSADRDENPHLEFVLTEAAGAVAALRAEGKTVLLHCVQAQSRTPTVAALYAKRHLGVDGERALRDVRVALPGARPNAAFSRVLTS